MTTGWLRPGDEFDTSLRVAGLEPIYSSYQDRSGVPLDWSTLQDVSAVRPVSRTASTRR